VLANKGAGRRRKAPPVLLPASLAQQRLRDDVDERQAVAAAMRAARDALKHGWPPMKVGPHHDLT